MNDDSVHRGQVGQPRPEPVSRTAPVIAADVTDPAGDPFYAHGVDATVAGTVLRSTDETILPRPGEVVLPEWAIQAYAVRDGDTIVFDVAARELNVELSDDEIASRVAAYESPPQQYRNGVLGKYAKLVGSAAEGAVTG